MLTTYKKKSSLTKIQNLGREVKSIFKKVSDEFNLMMALQMERESIIKFKDSLTDLRIIIEEMKSRK